MMNMNNPASQPCINMEKSPDGVHNWVRRADGTADCLNCGCRLTPVQATEAFAPEGGSVNRKAGKGPDKGAAA